MSTPPDRVQFHFQNAEEHRMIFADGAWGGLTPSGNLKMGFYSHFRANPDSVAYDVSQPGKLTEVERNGAEELIRLIHVDVLMTVEGAKSLRDWLIAKIQEAETAKQSSGEL